MSRRRTHTATLSLRERDLPAALLSSLNTFALTQALALFVALSRHSLSLSLSTLPSAFCFVFYILSSPFVLFLLPIFAHFAWFARFAFMLHTDTHSHTHACTYTLLWHSPLVSFTFCFFLSAAVVGSWRRGRHDKKRQQKIEPRALPTTTTRHVTRSLSSTLAR